MTAPNIDLLPGDVISVCGPTWDEPLTGKIWQSKSGDLRFGEYGVLFFRGRESEGWSIEVVKRAPRPFYVNHDRTHPVEGDVAKPASGLRGEYRPVDRTTMAWWRWDAAAGRYLYTLNDNFQREGELRLLVDGNTGMTVPFDGQP